MGPEKRLTRLRTDAGSAGTIPGEAERARLASTIIAIARAVQASAQPTCPFFRHRISAAIPFMIAMQE